MPQELFDREVLVSPLLALHNVRVAELVPEVAKLKEFRSEFGLSRSTIVPFIGCTEASLYRWEKGVCRPSRFFSRRIKKVNQTIEEVRK